MNNATFQYNCRSLTTETHVCSENPRTYIESRKVYYGPTIFRQL